MNLWFGRKEEFDQCWHERLCRWAYPTRLSYQFAVYQHQRMTTFCWFERRGMGELGLSNGNLPFLLSWRGTLQMLVFVLETCFLLHSLIGANTGGLKGFRTQLFIFVWDHVYAQWELVDICSLSAKIEDSNFRVRYTTVESGLWVWLSKISKMSQSIFCRDWPCSCSICNISRVFVPSWRYCIVLQRCAREREERQEVADYRYFIPRRTFRLDF